MPEFTTKTSILPSECLFSFLCNGRTVWFTPLFVCVFRSSLRVHVLLTCFSCQLKHYFPQFSARLGQLSEENGLAAFAATLTCWTCPERPDNDACNAWAPDLRCPLREYPCACGFRCDEVARNQGIPGLAISSQVEMVTSLSAISQGSEW